jgi:hypothetical protein
MAAITGTAAAHKSTAAAKPLIIIRFGMFTSSSKTADHLMYWAPVGSIHQVVNLRFIEVALPLRGVVDKIAIDTHWP